MGQSTDAILFYGFHAEEGDWDEIIGDDWEDAYAAKKGDPEPGVPYDTAENKKLHSDFWNRKSKLVDAEPCEVGTHCSGDFPMPFVCVKASKTRACRGYPEEIKSLDVGEDWKAILMAFCELLGIPWQEPKWWLVSDWN